MIRIFQDLGERLGRAAPCVRHDREIGDPVFVRLKEDRTVGGERANRRAVDVGMATESPGAKDRSAGEQGCGEAELPSHIRTST
jgi:hypothetical protein